METFSHILLYSFYAAIIIQIGYWIAFYLGFKKIADVSPRYNENLPPISVIVVYKNNKNTIQNTLQSLVSQQYPTFEVLAMQDFSTDGSEMLAQKISHPRLRHVHTSQDVPGKKFALSEAISFAKHDLLLLTDGDCITTSERWIDAMVTAMNGHKNTQIVLGYSPMTPMPSMVNAFSRYETVLTAIQYLSYAAHGSPYMGVGRNLMYTKRLFEDQNGFQYGAELPGGDDDLFIQKAASSQNVAICIHPNAHVVTPAPTTWHQFFRQKQRHISTSSYYQKKHKLLLGLYGATQIWWLFSFVVLLIFMPAIWPYLLLAICLKWWLQYITTKSIFPKLQAASLSSRLPLLDIAMSVYLGIMAIAQPFYRRKW